MGTAELKAKAKEQLRGNWGIAVISILIGTFIMNLSTGGDVYERVFNVDLSRVSISFNILSLVIDGFLTAGICRFTLNIATGEADPQVVDIFSQTGIFLKTMGLNLLTTIIIAIGFVLLFVPGVILALMYSQAYYIMVEDNSKGIIECMQESREMMRGYKMDLFVLELSFIGWILLSIITVGIASLWVNPYMKVTEANFHLWLKEQYK